MNPESAIASLFGKAVALEVTDATHGMFDPKIAPITAKVELPTLHRSQAKLRWVMYGNRFVVARCGRRWGKNVFGESVAIDDAVHGRRVGWFAPENKRLSESYQIINEALESVKKSSDKTRGMIRTITGGSVEFWSLEDENAGRSRKYHRVIGDEVAFTKPKTIDWWAKACRPTLLDYRGRALMMSNTAGIDPDNFLYELCHNPKHGFIDFHAPTKSNPHLPADEIAKLERDNLPLVFRQEYLAEFVDWRGQAFFAWDNLLINGQPQELPVRCEAVFATMDTATKAGKEHDGTAVVYWALMRNHVRPVGADGSMGSPYSLIVLDWDLVQIEGAFLETWLVGVAETLQEFGVQCGAMRGSVGILIEDKGSGSVLLQQAANRNILAHAIDSKLTAMGKDERAISVSGYHYRGLIKIARPAHDRMTTFKDGYRNHFMTQVTSFRVGDREAYKRADDVLDCYTMGVATALGNADGF